MPDFSRSLISLGLLLVLLGVVTMYLDKIPGFGRLPGDILIQRGKVTFYFPITTMILLSILIAVLMQIFGRK
jgi:hypothetical protein